MVSIVGDCENCGKYDALNQGLCVTCWNKWVKRESKKKERIK